MSRLAGGVSSVLDRVTWSAAVAVTLTGGVVKVPGLAERLIASAVLVATVPLGVEPSGNLTSTSRSPLLPAVSGLFITNCTRVRPEPM